MSNKTKNKALKSPNSIGMREGIGYMFGDVGNLLILTYISTYLKVLYTDVFEIDSGSLALLFFIVRLWDAVNDPIWGYVVDSRKPGKNGKFRPYIRAVCIPLAFSAVICFANVQNLITSKGALLAFAYITYTVYGMLYTGINIPYGSLASVITDDSKGRTLLSTFRSVGGGVGGAPVTLLIPLIVYVSTGASDPVTGKAIKAFDPQRAFFAVIGLAVFSVFAYLLCYYSTKERVTYSKQSQKVDMKKTYGGMFTSRPFIAVAVSGILISGLLQYGSMNQYLFKNYFVNTNLSIWMTIANYGPMALMILFVPRLVERFGKKELCSFGLALAAVASIIIAILRPTRDQAFIYLALNFVIGFGYSFMSITVWAVVMDCIDYQEVKTGLKNEGAIYAVYTFSRKLGQTVADSGGLKLLAWTGYDKANAGLGYVAGVGDKILTICTVVPAVVYTLIFILMAFVYPLTKPKLEKQHEVLLERRSAQAAE